MYLKFPLRIFYDGRTQVFNYKLSSIQDFLFLFIQCVCSVVSMLGGEAMISKSAEKIQSKGLLSRVRRVVFFEVEIGSVLQVRMGNLSGEGASTNEEKVGAWFGCKDTGWKE